MRRSVTIATPAASPGQVEVFVATRTGATMLSPDEARTVAAELLVAADRAEGIVVPSLAVALGKGVH